MARDGPMIARGHRAWPDIKLRDHYAVHRALRRTGGGSSATDVSLLERDIAAYCGARHAVAVDSGTSALKLGLVAAGVGAGDEVITSSLSFAASGLAIGLVGARPVWCDIRPDTATIDTDEMKRLITSRTRAILPVAVHGIFVDTAPVQRIADDHGLAVIWDICQAIGARDGDRIAGSLGTASALSLNATKALQAGEGGVLLTNSPETYEAATLYACFGEQRPRLGPDETRSYWSRYLGDNCRMPPMTAALGRSQLRRIDGYLARARRNCALLEEVVRDIPGVSLLTGPPGCTPSPWHPRVLLDPAAHGWAGPAREFRDRVISALRVEGLPVDTWQRYPLPAAPAFRRDTLRPWHADYQETGLRPWTPAAVPVASRLLDCSLTVGMFPHPLYVQPRRVMKRYGAGLRAVFSDIDRVLTAPYTPRRPAPPIPAADL